MSRFLAIVLLLTTGVLYGSSSLDHRIAAFFDKYNVTTNASTPDQINSELGVHFLGGGGVARTNVYDVSPIHISLPKFSSGCGGIDYTLGGINIASKEEMKKALKSIASNGVGYAFLLGIETVSPVVASTMKQIQTWANQLNAININSCELASSLVQGVWPKETRASSYICEHASTTNPLFKDLIEAKHGCRDDPAKKEKAFEAVQKSDKDIFIGKYNVAWKALENSDLDPETKNLFMNITGTIVVLGEKKVSIYPPQHKKGLEILRIGGTLQNGYKIASNNIEIFTEAISISPEHAWKTKIQRILSSLQNKLLSEKSGMKSTLSNEEKQLISTTRFPIGSLLSLMAQYNGKGGNLAIERYSDIIAFERVLIFAEEVIRDTLYRAESLRAAQVTGYELDEYIKQVNQVLKDIQALNRENLQQITAEHEIINYLMNIDRTLREKERGV